MWDLKRIFLIKKNFKYKGKPILYFFKKWKNKKNSELQEKFKFIIKFFFFKKKKVDILSQIKFYYNINKTLWYIDNSVTIKIHNYNWKKNVFVKKYNFCKKIFFLPLNYFLYQNIIKKIILDYSFLIKKGKKLLVFFIWYNLLCLLKNKLKIDIFFFLQLVIIKIMPLLFFHIKYASGKKYKIPYLISKEKSYKLALHWLFLNSTLRKESTLILKLFNELIDSYKLKSSTIKYKYTIYKIAKENRIFLYLFKRKKKKWN